MPSRRRRSQSSIVLTSAVILTLGCVAARPGAPSQAAGARQASQADSALVARARVIHSRIITIDSHAGFATDPLNTCGAAPRQVDLPMMRQGGLDAAFFTPWVAQAERTPENYAAAREQALGVFRAIHRLTDELCRDQIGLASSPGDVERIVGAGKLAAAIGMENGFMIGRDLSLLRTFKELGAGYFSLTHQGHNDIADSSEPSTALGDPPSEHGGVSAFGARVIEELNRLGIVIDVSHASNEAARQAMRLSHAPVIASHSSVHALAAHSRNMDDETLLALKANGGVIQITPVAWYIESPTPEERAASIALWEEFGVQHFGDILKLDPVERAELERRNAEFETRWPQATVHEFVDHIDYVVRLIGIDHVGIGSDFDGGGGITGWMYAAESPNVTIELVRRGYSEEDIRKIWGGNLLRVWREVERIAARSGGAAGTETRPLAITHVTVVDATGAPPRADMTVMIAGDRIVAMDTSPELTPPSDAQVIEAAGKFLIPGLWDMHFHLDDPELWPTGVTRAEKEMVFPLLIANGVTGIRDMAGSLEQLTQWRERIALGQLLGPRIVAAGPFIDGPSARWPGSLSVSSEAEARAAVRALRRRGADFIKVYSGLPRAAFLALIDEATKLGMDVAGHVQDLVGASEVSDAGQRSMEHLDGIMLACSTEEEAYRREIARQVAERRETIELLIRGNARLTSTYSAEKCGALFQRFVSNGTWQVPTLYNEWRHANTTDSVLTSDPRIRYYAKPLRKHWISVSARDEKQPERLARLTTHYEWLFRLVKDMHRARVGILAGSDFGAQEYSFAGFGLHDELRLFVEAGMTPMEALQSATLNAARFLGMTDATGTVEIGKLADLVLLDANPLDDIRNTQRISAVVLNGRLFPKAELQQLLAAAEASASRQ
jgi:membrane dipeptidase